VYVQKICTPFVIVLLSGDWNLFWAQEGD